MLNDSRQDRERFVRQVSRLGSLSIILFSIACGGTVGLPVTGLPLLFGKAYAAAIASRVDMDCARVFRGLRAHGLGNGSSGARS